VNQPLQFIRRPRLGDYLQLVRVWNLPTAIVDPYAGYLLAAQPGSRSLLHLCLVMLVSAFVYSTGMAANDLFDHERDKTLHPERPLPAGMIKRKAAGRFTGLLMLCGLSASALLGLQVLLLCFGLIVLTFTYNGWLKHKGLAGCLNMGACRFANMWLGIAAAGGSVGRLWPLPATLGLYVTSITLLSLQEEESVNKTGFYALVSPLLIVLLPLAGFAVAKLEREPAAWLALLPLTLLAMWLFATAAGAARSLNSASIGSVVRVAVTGIILLDSAILFSYGKQLEGLACALVLLPALILIRYAARRPSPSEAS